MKTMHVISVPHFHERKFDYLTYPEVLLKYIFFCLAFPLENERNDTVRVETLPPEKKALFSRNQSQTKKFGATRKNLDSK